MFSKFLKNNTLRIRLMGILLMLVFFSSSNVTLAANANSDEDETEEPFNAGDMIMHHILDSHVWHFWDGHYGTVYLPIIVYSA